MADVTHKHRAYDEYARRAELVEDVCEHRVKDRREKYLPKPNPNDSSEDNKARYEQYLKRAIFYNVTGHTRRGLVGAAFTRVPTLKVPADLEYVKTDIDGAGLSIFQQSQSVVEKVLSGGRHALYVDYPESERTLTQAEQRELNMRATVASISALSVINWKTTKVGAKHQLSLVVFRDDHEEDTEDGFGTETIEQYRALRLIDGEYVVQLWRKNDKGDWYLHRDFTPKDGAGKPWDFIPFTFVGAQNNDPSVDMAPLYDMAEINLGHYRNSADYEDSAFFCGQAQPWASGIDENFYRFLRANGVFFGSRALFPVPAGEQLGIVQAEPNTMVKEAMDAKEKQMLALGARLITPGSAVKTATEAQQDSETEHSVLSLVVSNVSEAYNMCLQWMARFNNAQLTEEHGYEINQEFTRLQVSADLINSIVALWQTGQWPNSELYAFQRRYGLTDPEKTDEQIKDELASQDPALDLTED